MQWSTKQIDLKQPNTGLVEQESMLLVFRYLT